ncbi:hypothetical protein [Nostoc sp.]|uniref:hypothetical protein n=1 Tax=Nostoc sp. TaxID=1180 RepID=UPI002FF0185B
MDGLLIVGLTPIGQASVTVLTLNQEWVINICAADKEIGRHPPVDDHIQRKIDTTKYGIVRCLRLRWTTPTQHFCDDTMI